MDQDTSSLTMWGVALAGAGALIAAAGGVMGLARRRDESLR
jgi:hypothetical protein